MTRGAVVDEFDSLLGIDAADERDVLAGELVRADFAWVDQLVARRRQLGLTQAEVARAMGRSQSVVSDIETMSTDPRLSTLRRYALAIGAAVRHRVYSHVALQPLIRAQSEGAVAARSASAGPGPSVWARGFYVSVSADSRFEVGAR